MNPHSKSTTLRYSALISGIAIVTMTVAAVMATEVTIGRLVVENDATVTLKNILTYKTTFNVGVLSWLIILISDVFAAWGLYIFLKPVSQNLSLLLAWFRLVYVAMLAVSIFNLVYVHLLIHQPGITSVSSTGPQSEKVMFYLNAFETMFSISLIVFSIHILLLGYLSLKSAYIPKIFGIVLFLAFAGYSITNISKLVFPGLNDIIQIIEWIFFIPMLSEVALGIWLMIIGLRKKDITTCNE